ncbi:MFS transporter [Thalassococcus sp. S3]|uniref:MFS transporter n=1 Tax=Thalassococcus sp. S3 TaxID=2017482 RepID=UPI00102C2861|nr:MFS transporter [Thalassococcus sp. S3]
MTETAPSDQPPIGAKVALVLGLALMAMGQTVLFALLGPVSRELGLTEIMVGGIISLAAVTVVLGSPWWGRRVDRWGRRPVFLMATCGLGVTTFLFALTLQAGLAGLWTGVTAFALLALARMIYGFAVTGAQPAAAAWMADNTTAEERTGGMALIGAAFGLGAILGPTLAWLMSGLPLLAPLYLIAGLALCATLLAWLTLPETVPVEAAMAQHLSPTDPRLRGTLLIVLTAFIVVASIQQSVAFYVQDTAGLDAAGTAARVGQAMAVLALLMFLTQGGIAALKPDPRRLIPLGAAIGCAGCVVLALWPSHVGVLLAHALFGLGFGAIIPGLQGRASLAVGPQEQGATGGLVAAGMAAGYAIGPVFGTALYTVLPVLPYLVGAGLMAGVVVATLPAILRRRGDDIGSGTVDGPSGP